MWCFPAEGGPQQDGTWFPHDFRRFNEGREVGRYLQQLSALSTLLPVDAPQLRGTAL